MSGRVLTGAGSALPDALITALPAGGGGENESTHSDEAGRFELTLALGIYRLAGEKAGYLRQEYGARKPVELGRDIVAGPGCWLKDVDLVLIPASRISGVVRYDNDGACKGCVVQLLIRATASAKSHLIVQGSTSSTNDGSFEFTGLSPGAYYIVAAPPRSPIRQPSRLMEVVSEPAYVPTYYPAETDWGAAAPIYVIPGSDAPAIDIVLKKAPVFRACGKLVGIRKCTRPSVQLLPFPGGFYQAGYYEVITDTDSKFCAVRMPAGRVRLTVTCADGGPVPLASLSFEIVDKDLSNVVVEAFGTATLRLQAVYGEESGARHVEGINVRLFPLDGPAINPPEITTGQAVSLPARDYQIRVKGVPSGMFLASIQVSGSPHDDGVIPLGGLTDATLTLRLSNRAGTVRGTVETEPGRRAHFASVLLIPDPSPPHRADLFHSTPVTQDGSFEVSGVAPGRYLLAAVGDQNLVNVFDPEEVRSRLPGAVRVEIKAGEVTSRVLQLIEN